MIATSREDIESTPSAIQAPMIQAAATQRRIRALFRAMSTDFLLREQFVTDPAQVFSEYVHRTRVPADKASVSNQFIYSVMASPGLMHWASEYSARHGRDFPPINRFAEDFSRAVVQEGGWHVVVALLRSTIAGHDVFSSQNGLLQILFPGWWVSDDGAGGGGEAPKTGGAEGGPGGTAKPTGTGTEQSGTGTEHSLGTDHGYIQVTIQALVQFSTRLLRVGALDIAVDE
jgi:hypothetical protein